VLIDRNTLPELAEFIQGDWDSIYGLGEQIELAAFRGYSPGTGWVHAIKQMESARLKKAI
jgi:hypothetical protein